MIHKSQGFLLINILILLSTWLIICQLLLKSTYIFYKSANLAWQNTQCKELAYSALYYAKNHLELIPFTNDPFLQTSNFFEISDPNIGMIKLNKNNHFIYVESLLYTNNCKQRYQANYVKNNNLVKLINIQKI